MYNNLKNKCKKPSSYACFDLGIEAENASPTN